MRVAKMDTVFKLIPRPIRSLAHWYFWHEPRLYLPDWAVPYVLGISLGRYPHKVEDGK